MRVFLTTLAVPASSTASNADAELIRDALWAHASPLGDIEHITVTVLPAGIGIAIFLNHKAANPEEQANALIRNALRRSSVISQWGSAIEGEM
jgi:hypothetical protein